MTAFAVASGVVRQLCDDLCATAGLGIPTREPIRVWQLSGVERLRFTTGRTAVFKYATGPFTAEHHTLTLASSRAVPTPQVLAAQVRAGVLGMLLEDLGDHVRDAQDKDASIAAAAVHATGPAEHLDTFDEQRLRALPARTWATVQQLQATGRFTGPVFEHLLARLDAVAPRRAHGADLPPFGLCHGELHPTSLHIGTSGWRVLDFGKAFTGPGLLDLATWQGTRHEPDVKRLDRMLRLYVAAGGHPAALERRGGLPAALWAMGWHRVWAAAWLVELAGSDVGDPTTDATTMTVVYRQLASAGRLLRVAP